MKAISHDRFLITLFSFGLSALFLLSSFGVKAGDAPQYNTQHFSQISEIGPALAALSQEHGSPLAHLCSEIEVKEEDDVKDEWKIFSRGSSNLSALFTANPGINKQGLNKVPLPVPFYILFHSWKSFLS